MNKQLTYGYDESGMTHQPRVIYGGNPELSYDLYWDANGNLAQVTQCGYNKFRFHEWDDNNRLRAVIGPNLVGFYGYDGNGDRVWKPTANRTNACICSSVPRRLATRAQRESKLTGPCQIDNQNGGEMSYSALLDDAVLYPNPYLTITPTGYTKHYYIGSERIATALGEGGWGYASVNLNVHDNEVVDNFFENYKNELPCEQCSETGNEDIYGDRPSALQYSCKPQCLRGIKLLYAQNGYLYNEIIQHEISSGKQESLFFTHSDHLGSASWITDGVGNPVQYIHYAPYGELLANQSLYGYDERYKFTGKERDAESGYDYFGARYLLSDAGIWLSVDPLADKYIHLSPYMYCNGNPIKYIDPDGRIVIAASSKAQKRLLSTLSCSERKYVRFNKNGVINVSRLNRCKSTSHNMTALKALAKSKDVTYNILVQNSSTSGETAGEDMIKAGGVTEMYGLDKDASPDPTVVNIISGDHLTGEEAAKNMAHEAFVHAYLYEINGHDGRAAGHDRPNRGYVPTDAYVDPETGLEYPNCDIIFEDHPNDMLNQFNEAAQREASANFDCGL